MGWNSPRLYIEKGVPKKIMESSAIIARVRMNSTTKKRTTQSHRKVFGAVAFLRVTLDSANMKMTQLSDKDQFLDQQLSHLLLHPHYHPPSKQGATTRPRTSERRNRNPAAETRKPGLCHPKPKPSGQTGLGFARTFGSSPLLEGICPRSLTQSLEAVLNSANCESPGSAGAGT